MRRRSDEVFLINKIFGKCNEAPQIHVRSQRWLDRQYMIAIGPCGLPCQEMTDYLGSRNDKNERPPGDEDFVRRNKQRPRDINFYFHDETV